MTASEFASSIHLASVHASRLAVDAGVAVIERDRLIVSASAAGHSLRTIAGWAGLNHSVVQRIVNKGKGV